jgi:hypothetical protein
MFRRTPIFYAVLAAACVITSAALQSAAFAYPNDLERMPAFMTPAAIDSKIPVLYVSTYKQNTNAVYLLNANNISGPPLGKITDGIDGANAIAVDTHGVLYVANGLSRQVTLYQPGAIHPFRTITGPKDNSPRTVAVGADGTLAIGFGGGGPDATLFIYDRGSLTPTRKISFPLGNQALVFIGGIAIDASENVFVSVERYPGGQGQQQHLKFTPGSTVGMETGIDPGRAETFDRAGNLYVSLVGEIEVLRPGTTHPFRRIFKGLHTAIGVAAATDGRLFVADLEGPGEIVEYAPNGLTPIAEHELPAGLFATGAALRPGQP